MKILTIAVMIAKESPTSKDEIFLMADKNETFKLVALLTGNFGYIDHPFSI